MSVLQRKMGCVAHHPKQNNAKPIWMTQWGYSMGTGSPVGKDGLPGNQAPHHWCWMRLRWPQADNTFELKKWSSAKWRRRICEKIRLSNMQASRTDRLGHTSWWALHKTACLPCPHSPSNNTDGGSSLGEERQEVNILCECQRKGTVHVLMLWTRM